MEHRTKGRTPPAVIVIFIIMLIAAAFAIPVLQRVPRGHGPYCQRQMKECVAALLIYAEDYDDTLPSSACVSGSETWNKEDFLVFATRVGKLPPPPDARPQTWTQVLWDHMKNKDIFFCPEDPSNHRARDAKVSYWWKTAVDKAWYGEDCPKHYRKITDYPHAAHQIILYEHNTWHFDQADMGMVHGAQINCAFLDGRVKCHQIVNATSGDPLDCAANEDGEPMYFNFDEDRDESDDSPPDPFTPATYVDPGRYSDRFPKPSPERLPEPKPTMD